MTSSTRLAAMIACAVCVTPAYGGYEFQKVTDDWVYMCPGHDPVLNNHGQILFTGQWGTSPLWFHDGTGLQSIGFGPTTDIQSFDMNDVGDVVYSSYNGTYFLVRYSGGTYQTLASSLSSTIRDITYVAINNEREIAASLAVETDPYYDNWSRGLYKIDIDNQMLPWIYPERNPFVEPVAFSQLALADTGVVAFHDDYGAYLSLAPDSYILTAAPHAGIPSWPLIASMNAVGQVAYPVWSDDDPPVPSLVITDGVTTQTRGLFADSQIETLAINDAGDVVYLGTHSASGTTGIFVNDSSLPVAAIGNDLNGSPVTWLTLSSRGFNDAGQIVFWADLEDGSSGLYLATPAAGLPGDFNGDGLVNTEDINAFILALTDGDAFAAAFPLVALSAADPSGDGLINTEDINPFIALLTGGGGAIIPEPGSAVVMLLAAGAGLMARRRW